MNDTQFWLMIENAWESTTGLRSERIKLAYGKLPDDELSDLSDALEDVIPALRESLEKLDQDELMAFDRILEQKLWDIDRQEIQEYTDGSDDGFLYARGFIVAIGREYYDAVDNKPSRARMDVECEEICYVSLHLYEDQFGDMPESGISRTSGSNPNGWPA